VGVAIDGIPIYGPIDEYGRQLTQQDLDDCGGRYDHYGRYKYHTTVDPPFWIRCLKGEIRNDLNIDPKQFFCSCPYDDTYLGKPDGFHPDVTPAPRTCVFDSTRPHNFAKCEDRINSTYSVPREWARVRKTIDLTPCCPQGTDCGLSCKMYNETSDSFYTNPLCKVESRRVTVIQNQPPGFCQDLCQKRCYFRPDEEEVMKCTVHCMDFCLNKGGIK